MELGWRANPHTEFMVTRILSQQIHYRRMFVMTPLVTVEK